jgi:UTP--glucose-1-phosphate uridylyltransferase
MRNELNRMANNIQDPEAKRIFGAEMEDFFLLFNRYLTEKAKGEKMYVPLVWSGLVEVRVRV